MIEEKIRSLKIGKFFKWFDSGKSTNEPSPEIQYWIERIATLLITKGWKASDKLSREAVRLHRSNTENNFNLINTVENPLVSVITTNSNYIDEKLPLDMDANWIWNCLRNSFGYDFIPHGNSNDKQWYNFGKLPKSWKYLWSRQEILEMCNTTANTIEQSFKNDSFNKPYDCLIFIFSGHGIENGIICADAVVVEKEPKIKLIHPAAIIKLITMQLSEKARKIPKVFLFDCCQGPLGFLDHTRHSKSYQYSTWVDVFNSKHAIEKLTQENKKRTCDLSPDYNVMLLQTAVPNTKSQSHPDFGSYCIATLFKLLRRNNKQEKEILFIDLVKETFKRTENTEKQISMVTLFGPDTTNFILKTNKDAFLNMNKMRKRYLKLQNFAHKMQNRALKKSSLFYQENKSKKKKKKNKKLLDEINDMFMTDFESILELGPKASNTDVSSLINKFLNVLNQHKLTSLKNDVSITKTRIFRENSYNKDTDTKIISNPLICIIPLDNSDETMTTLHNCWNYFRLKNLFSFIPVFKSNIMYEEFNSKQQPMYWQQQLPKKLKWQFEWSNLDIKSVLNESVKQINNNNSIDGFIFFMFGYKNFYKLQNIDETKIEPLAICRFFSHKLNVEKRLLNKIFVFDFVEEDFSDVTDYKADKKDLVLEKLIAGNEGIQEKLWSDIYNIHADHNVTILKAAPISYEMQQKKSHSSNMIDTIISVLNERYDTRQSDTFIDIIKDVTNILHDNAQQLPVLKLIGDGSFSFVIVPNYSSSEESKTQHDFDNQEREEKTDHQLSNSSSNNLFADTYSHQQEKDIYISDESTAFLFNNPSYDYRANSPAILQNNNTSNHDFFFFD